MEFLDELVEFLDAARADPGARERADVALGLFEAEGAALAGDEPADRRARELYNDAGQ